MSHSSPPFKNFSDFYPYYLSEHRNKRCKQVHFIGTTGVLFLIVMAVIFQNLNLLWLVPVSGYGWAWLGHFAFEKNRPATFKYPFYSLRGDFVMFWHLLTGRLSFENNAHLKIS